MTPENVHYGKAEFITNLREKVLLSAFEAHPDRFVSRIPTPPLVPDSAWINKPKSQGLPASPDDDGMTLNKYSNFVTSVSHFH